MTNQARLYISGWGNLLLSNIIVDRATETNHLPGYIAIALAITGILCIIYSFKE